MDSNATYLATVVRLFEDYAESVIWFTIGTVSYEEACLSNELERGLRAWGARYLEIDPSKGWPSVEDENAYTSEGLRLARLLAEEIGEDFEVEVDSGAKKPRVVRLRGESSGTNARARAAFHARASDFKAEEKWFEEQRALGHTFSWAASNAEASDSDQV